MRPFGTATLLSEPASTTAAAPSSPFDAHAQPHSTPPLPTEPAAQSNSLFSRLAIKGSGISRVEVERLAREEERKKLAAKREEERRKREREIVQERENEKLRALAAIEERGFVVEVAGLVYGTSAEDVQVRLLCIGLALLLILRMGS